jgi:hypothetical protein
MKKISFLLLIITCLSLAGNAQWPSNVTFAASKANDSVVVSGDLANGSVMSDLSWAWSSSNACFVGFQAPKYQGNHVLFATSFPPRSIITITVSPTDANSNLSIYGYMMTAEDHMVVPDLPGCISCEADYKWDRPVKGKVQTSDRVIEFQNPTQNTYNIVIGVAAPGGVTSGQFNLKIKVKS